MSNYSLFFQHISGSCYLIYFEGAEDVESGGDAIGTSSLHDDDQKMSDMKKTPNETIFHSCITNRGAGMSIPELRFVLEAFGVYVNNEQLEEETKKYLLPFH